jgi:hypothetical protein
VHTRSILTVWIYSSCHFSHHPNRMKPRRADLDDLLNLGTPSLIFFEKLFMLDRRYPRKSERVLSFSVRLGSVARKGHYIQLFLLVT